MKFKIGDRVICIDEYDGNDLIKGEKGIIKSLGSGCFGSEKNSYLVEFDNSVSGHYGHGGHYIDGHCWYIAESILRLEQTVISVKQYGIVNFVKEYYK